MTYYDSETYGGGRKYLGKDVMGSVWGVTDGYGEMERYEYDVFGGVYEGDLSGGMNPAVCCASRIKPPKITCKVIFYPANCQGSPYIVVFAAQSDAKTYKRNRLPGYTGKPYDVATGMYNYGYRDYAPEAARFTTEDPIRDGANWFVYVNNDPVNWIDLWGLRASDSTWEFDVPGITIFATPKPNNYYDIKDISENLSKAGTVASMGSDIVNEMGYGANFPFLNYFSNFFNISSFALDFGIMAMDPNPDTISDAAMTAIGFVPILGGLASSEVKLTKKAIVATATTAAEFNQSVKNAIKKDPFDFLNNIINYFATYK